MTLGEIQARIFYYRQALITPVAHQICSQQYRKPDDPTPLLKPHDLFPNLIEPPPKVKQADPKAMSREQRRLARLEKKLSDRMITPKEFQHEVQKLAAGTN
jgi:hypothetical protein